MKKEIAKKIAAASYWEDLLNLNSKINVKKKYFKNIKKYWLLVQP